MEKLDRCPSSAHGRSRREVRSAHDPQTHASLHLDDFARRSARAGSTRTSAPIDAHRARAARRRRRTRRGAPTSRRRSTCRRSRASAMDGYAVVAADTAGATRDERRRACGCSIASTPARSSRTTVAPGTCAEIATGAPMPAGADAVVMVEETARRAVTRCEIFAAGRRRTEHRHAAAPTSRAGDRVVAAGDVLTPSRVGALAAVGRADVEVYAQAARRDSLDRQRSRRRRAAAAAGTDLRRQPLHAVGGRRQRTAASRSRSAPRRTRSTR